jgi:hypothetical protein
VSERNLLMAGFVLSLLTGCGGGGGGAAPSPSPSPPPPPAPASYQVGGTVSGLDGTVVLQLGGANNLAVSANGSFAFASTLASGASYSVTVATQPGPPLQSCTVSNGAGIIGAANVTDVSVTCADVPLTLAASMPVSGATDVSRTVIPSLTFSAGLDASTVIPANVTLSAAGGAQAVTLAASGTRLDVTPTNRLLAGTSYTLRVGTGLHGANGEVPSAPLTITFTTVAGEWSPPVLIENGAGAASKPNTIVDADGNALAVWVQNDGIRNRIRFNRFVVASGWAGDTHVVTDPAAAASPHIGVDGAGIAHMVWQQVDTTSHNVFANRFAPSYGFTFPAPVSSGYAAGNARIAVNNEGRAALVWTQLDDAAGGSGTISQVWAANYFPASGWTVPALIDTFAVGGASIVPQVAIDDAGRVTVVWAKAHAREAIEPRFDIWSNRYTTGGAWTGAARVETNDSGSAGHPQITSNGVGDVMAVWHASDGVRENVWAARRAAGGGWEAPELIETGNGAVGYPQVASDASGNAIAVWTQYTTAPNPDVMANRFQPGSGWGNAIAVETDDDFVDAPQLAMNPGGIAQLVWIQFREASRYDVMANRFNPGSGWSGADLISTEGAESNFSASGPQVAINSAGVTQAVWLRTDGTRESVWSSRFD